MKHLMTAMVMVAALLAVQVERNPVCLIPVPFHCDPPPDGDGPG